MTRIETIAEGVTLYLGDCREILPTLGSVDAVVTDPPFNAGKEFQNDSMSENDWRAFCFDLAAGIYTLNPKNCLIEVGKNDKHMRAAFDQRFRYRWAITLNYTNAMRQGAVGYSNTGLVYWYGDGSCHQRYMDRIDAPLENTVSEFSHPSPKTTFHYAQLVRMFSRVEHTVCDPFLGSGTTGVAAVKLGRKFIGIEIEPKYFDIACKRISDALKQPDMFVAMPKPKQEAFEI